MDKKKKYIFDTTKDISHGNKTFFEHLFNTSKIIEKNFPDEKYLIDAGLYHSVYGTCYFDFDSKVNRKDIEKLIGKQAEELVYTYCKLDNRIEQILEHKFKDAIQKDLYILEYANLLEQFISISKSKNLPFPQEEIERHKKIILDQINTIKERLSQYYNLNIQD